MARHAKLLAHCKRAMRRGNRKTCRRRPKQLFNMFSCFGFVCMPQTRLGRIELSSCDTWSIAHISSCYSDWSCVRHLTWFSVRNTIRSRASSWLVCLLLSHQRYTLNSHQSIRRKLHVRKRFSLDFSSLFFSIFTAPFNPLFICSSQTRIRVAP